MQCSSEVPLRSIFYVRGYKLEFVALRAKCKVQSEKCKMLYFLWKRLKYVRFADTFIMHLAFCILHCLSLVRAINENLHFVLILESEGLDLYDLSAGTHQLSIELTNGGTTIYAHYDLNVAKNVWSNVTTYVALVIVAIIVVIIAVVYMRANPRNKPTTTFTELEQQEKAAKAAEPKAAPSKTEKKKYGGSEEDSGKIKYTSSRRK